MVYNISHTIKDDQTRSNSYEETLHLLKSPTNAKRLRRSIADAKAGRLIEHDINTDDALLTCDDEVDA